MEHVRTVIGALVVTLVAAGCATPESSRRFTSTEIVWEDPDRQPIEEPEEYWSGLYWDGADKMIFRPISHFFLFEDFGPATNTNALDEVPNSSWYTNRMALRAYTPEEVVRASCEDEIDTGARWLVRAGKVDGANPGFTVEDTSDGKMYLLKFDSEIQQERATAADVIGSKIYWGAGFSVPCNRIVFFDLANLEIGEGARKKDNLGRKTPITEADVAKAIAFAPRREDGRVRASASLFLSGKPLGPFKYEETRDADPNDVIPHEDRRELRGSKALAAWLLHFDAREQNTFTSFIPIEGANGKGYIQHHILDWGDCFGSEWDPDLLTRRFGHSWYLYVPHVLADFFALGMIQRPWDTATKYEDGPIFGYYDVANFEPGAWYNGYGHPAFARADEVDMFWGAKIISRFTDAHIRALVAEGQFTNPANSRYLERTLIGRRDKLVRHYFERVSPFDLPRTRAAEVCVDDLGIKGGYYAPEDAFYGVRLEGGAWRAPTSARDGRVCVDLSNDIAGDYVVLELRVRRAHQRKAARSTKVHFRVTNGELAVVGIDRY